jgi:hypothetical protein
LDELLHCKGPKKLAALADTWLEDERPFARRMLFAYVDDGCDRPEHSAGIARNRTYEKRHRMVWARKASRLGGRWW